MNNNKHNRWHGKVTLIALAAVMAAALGGVMGLSGPVAVAAEEKRPTDQELEDMFQRAVMLAQYGFYAEAEKQCQDILKYKPDQPTVAGFLKKLESRKPPVDKKAILRKRMEMTVIPQLRTKQAAAGDVFQFLAEESAKHAPDKQRVNFVLFVPPDVKPQPISLEVDKVTLLDAVKYVTMQSGLRYFIDDNAVIIYHESNKPGMIPEPPKSEPSAEPHAEP
jgi:hypothetical protein